MKYIAIVQADDGAVRAVTFEHPDLSEEDVEVDLDSLDLAENEEVVAIIEQPGERPVIFDADGDEIAMDYVP